MLITKYSILTRVQHTREIDVTEEQLAEWKAGALIQKVMPNLSPADREFILTGTTPEEWAEAFPEVE